MEKYIFKPKDKFYKKDIFTKPDIDSAIRRLEGKIGGEISLSTKRDGGPWAVWHGYNRGRKYIGTLVKLKNLHRSTSGTQVKQDSGLTARKDGRF